MGWEKVSNTYWRRQTHRTTGHVWTSGESYRWVVHTRHWPDNPAVVRLGGGETKSVSDARQSADELIEPEADEQLTG